MSPAAKGRRAPSGSCVVAEGGPNSIRAEISRSHGTMPLVPMTPASAKPEMGRPGGGYAPVGVGPASLPRPQAPGGSVRSVRKCVSVCTCNYDKFAFSSRGPCLSHCLSSFGAGCLRLPRPGRNVPCDGTGNAAQCNLGR